MDKEEKKEKEFFEKNTNFLFFYDQNSSWTNRISFIGRHWSMIACAQKKKNIIYSDLKTTFAWGVKNVTI